MRSIREARETNPKRIRKRLLAGVLKGGGRNKMNIQEAKEEIIHTLRSYHAKNEKGAYTYPLVRQRPILLIGPPGIGKTAIMEQIASECGIGLVSYTITHHTRQSAIGLPRIVTRIFDGEKVSITEYTMSEIIASVYDCMERSGKREGILFIDEINCVSETLAPVMLEFLQNKTFGTHRVPDGWMIVAAGNPAEYNKSVREFDIATLDRVRKIEVEADCSVWLAYALERNVHGAILTFLTLKKDRFYQVKREGQTVTIVTARGWEDLSEIVKSYEKLDVEVNAALAEQFLQDKETAREFAFYYRLYRRYRDDFCVDGILSETLPEETYRSKVEMARKGSFDERITLIGLLLDALNEDFIQYGEVDRRLRFLQETIRQLFARWDTDEKVQESKGFSVAKSTGVFLRERRRQLQVKTQAELLREEDTLSQTEALDRLEDYFAALAGEHFSGKEEAAAGMRELFAQDAADRKTLVRKAGKRLERAFAFAADCFGADQEMLLLVSGLTRNRRAMEYIILHGSAGYLRYSENLVNRIPEENLREVCRELLNQ